MITEILPEAHRHFSADFFNRTWDLLDRSARDAGDTETMISLAHASLAHWRAREDCSARNLSIGYWLLSRVLSIAGRPGEARRYGLLCLDASELESPFYLAYAHEAIARAAELEGDIEGSLVHLDAARKLLGAIGNEEERRMLETDLESLDGGGAR